MRHRTDRCPGSIQETGALVKEGILRIKGVVYSAESIYKVSAPRLLQKSTWRDDPELSATLQPTTPLLLQPDMPV